jgi:hypothetical protein
VEEAMMLGERDGEWEETSTVARKSLGAVAAPDWFAAILVKDGGSCCGWTPGFILICREVLHISTLLLTFFSLKNTVNREISSDL